MVATLALALSASVLDAPVATALLLQLERSEQPDAKMMPLLEQLAREVCDSTARQRGRDTLRYHKRLFEQRIAIQCYHALLRYLTTRRS